MKGSLKIWMVILGIVAAGTGITCLTNSYVTHQIEKIAETVPVKQEAVLVKTEREFADSGQGAAESAAEMPREESALPAQKVQQEDVKKEAVALPEATEEATPAAPAAQKQEDEKGALQDASALGRAAPAALSAPDEQETFEETKPAKLAESGQGALAGAPGKETTGDAEQKTEMFLVSEEKEHTAVLEITEVPQNLQEALGEYRERFPQIDLQVEQMRRSETENNMYSVKNTAQTELKIWEREMEGLYRLLCDSLDKTASEKLKKEQQEWLLLRDSRADEAAKRNSGGSLESVDYLASMAASNRERAYALLDKYQE